MSRRMLRKAKTLAARTTRLLTELNRVLQEVEGQAASVRSDGRPGRRPGAIAASRRRRLACPRCDRKFALPMNLGRHLSATHGRKAKRAA